MRKNEHCESRNRSCRTVKNIVNMSSPATNSTWRERPMPVEPRAARGRRSVEQPERRAQRRTKRNCDKATQRRRWRTRRRRLVNKSCEQHLACDAVLVCSARDEREHGQKDQSSADRPPARTKTTMAPHRKRETPGRGGSRRNPRQADHLETEGSADAQV